MLKYLWTVTQDLIVAVTLVTWMHAVLGRLYGRFGRRFHAVGIGAGVLAAIALAAVKGTSNRIVTSRWNHYTYIFILGFALVFIVLTVLRGRREDREPGVLGAIQCLAGSGYSAVMIFYALPGVLLYPFNFNTMGEGYLSSYYMSRLAGWALALVLLLAYSRLLYNCGMHLRTVGLLSALLCGGMAVNGAYCFGRYFAPWVNRARWLGWKVKYTDAEFGWIGNFMMFTANHAMVFIWLVVALAAVSLIVCFAQNIKVTEPWDNPAQRRKLRARNRSFRRMACAGLAGIALFTVFLTVVKGYDTRVIELSAPETYTVDAENIYVPVEAVNDFHLHRFEYTTENGVSVRWIVVRKPNSAAYGVGLDACDVCGNAGYYERNGQVVCRRCDVVMNINTIGFKGGCNPIPMGYEMGDGQLIFKLSDIIAGEKEFK